MRKRFLPRLRVRGMQTATSTFGLLERHRNGDEEAFPQLFEKYRRRLAVLIHYKLSMQLRRTTEVDDVLQEVFLIATRDIARFTYQSPGSFMRWLARIADHVITDEARRQSRQKRRAVEMVRFRSASNPGGPDPVDTETPSRIFAEQEGLRLLLERLNALPEDYRRVIVMAKVMGLSTQEMAEEMGRSREGVALLLHRAIQRFRALEDKNEG